MLDNGVNIQQPREGFHPYDTMTKNFAGSAGGTALWVASVSGHESTVQFLLTRGARVDSTDDAGKTPLHAACAAGHDEVARLLSDNGASFDSIADGGTPLMIACAAGHTECVRVLLKAGADPFKGVLVPDTRRGQQGLRTKDEAYLYAFHNGHREVVGLLRETPQYVTSRFAVHGVMQGTPPSSPDQPKSRRAKPTKTTPMRERADKAGVSDKIQATPPGVRELIAAGPGSSSPQLSQPNSNCMLSRRPIAWPIVNIVTRAEQQQPRNAGVKRNSQTADAKRKRASGPLHLLHA